MRWRGRPSICHSAARGLKAPSILIEHAQVQWAVDRTFGVRFVDLPERELDELEQLIDESIALDEGKKT